MKLAILAYFQGSYNDAVFQWLDKTHCKVMLHDRKNNLAGSFTAEYDEDRKIINITDETGMYAPDVNIPPQPEFMTDKLPEAPEPKTITTIPLEGTG